MDEMNEEIKQKSKASLTCACWPGGRDKTKSGSNATQCRGYSCANGPLMGANEYHGQLTFKDA